MNNREIKLKTKKNRLMLRFLFICICSRWRFFCFQCSPRIALILTFKTTVSLNNSNMKTIYETTAQLSTWQFEIKKLLLQWMYIYCLYIVVTYNVILNLWTEFFKSKFKTSIIPLHENQSISILHQYFYFNVTLHYPFPAFHCYIHSILPNT